MENDETLLSKPRANILLVDDQPANLLALRAILDDLGLNLVEARSGEEALERLLEDDFAVVLLDVQMPGRNGFETAKLIREQEPSRHTPIIFLTAYDSDRETLETAYSLGAVDFLVKPLIPVILKAKVTGFVELYEKTKRVEQESEAQSRRLIDFHEAVTTNMGEGLYAVDTKGLVTYMNPAAESLLGWKSAELLGRRMHDMIHHTHLDGTPFPAEECAGFQVLHEGKVLKDHDDTLIRKDGTFFPVVLSSSPLITKGKISGLVVIFRDVTERKRAEQALRFLADASATLATVVDYQTTLQKVAGLAVPQFADWCAVDIVEPDGSMQRLAVVHSDPAKVKLAQEFQRHYPPEPNSQRGLPQVMRTGKSDMMADIPDARLVQSAKDEEHLRLMRELGLKSYMCVPLKGRGKLIGALSFVSTESGRRYTDDDLAFAEELARRASIAIENAQLYAELRDADRRKDEFLAILAHELRNPLAPLVSGLQVMKLATNDGQAIEQSLAMMERQLTQLVRLVDDLMDVSRINQGKIDLRKERIELAKVVEHAVETSRPLIEASGHDLTINLPSHPIGVSADVIRLAQVLSNLLNDSARYTERGGHITLAVERQGSDAVVSVRDTGIGIPAEMLPKLFKMFTQVDRTLERSQSGLGIGLSLVKGLVEMHDGSIEAKSMGPGKGSEFIVRLPVVVGPVQARQKPNGDVEKSRSGPKFRILVADDNRDAAASLAMMLRLLRHQIQTTHDGMEAVQAAATFQPDIALLDIGMPKLNGYDAARHIRGQPWGKKVVLVALTGWGQEDDKRRATEAGFDHHMTKPVNIDAIQKLLASLNVTESGPAI